MVIKKIISHLGWVIFKGDLRKLANELIEDNENNQNN